MKQQLDTGKGKIQKICDLIRHETLEPAKQQAKEILENAQMQAQEIIENAKKESTKILDKTDEETKKTQKVFEASLSIACKQVIGDLKQKIEKKFFTEEIQQLVLKESTKLDFIEKLLTHLVDSIEKQGIDFDITAFIPKDISPRKINETLSSRIIEKLRENAVQVGDFQGGIKLQIHKDKLTIDISDDSLREMIAKYIREDFRNLLFEL